MHTVLIRRTVSGDVSSVLHFDYPTQASSEFDMITHGYRGDYSGSTIELRDRFGVRAAKSL